MKSFHANGLACASVRALSLAQLKPDDWPERTDRSALILDILALLTRGPALACEAGEKLLTGTALQLWRQAFRPLPVTLPELVLTMARNPPPALSGPRQSACPAAAPYTRLTALNSGRWPRGISEDRLIPDHIVPIDVLDGGDNAGINATV